MQIDVVLLPRDLQAGQLAGRCVVVFDVLRATTTMCAALDAGISEIRIFGTIEEAAAARHAFAGPALLCGEIKALPPAGFDLGNSPRQFDPARHAGRAMFLSTTNGTRAILASLGAAAIYAGALVNAAATAKAVAERGLPVTLLCSGTDAKPSMEDLLGCGAVIDSLSGQTEVILMTDLARVARATFAACRDDLPGVLHQTQAGHNVTVAGLTPDIEFAARRDAIPIAASVTLSDPPIVRCMRSA